MSENMPLVEENPGPPPSAEGKSDEMKPSIFAALEQGLPEPKEVASALGRAGLHVCSLAVGLALGVGLFSLHQRITAPISPLSPATYSTNIASLAAQVRRHAAPDVVDRCLAIINGDAHFLENSFAQAGQDFLLFHNYFSDVPYGKGLYIDIGSNHPYVLSNTYFFDRCLGWRGVCIEPNENYHPLYAQFNRTCTLIKACVADRPQTRAMDFSKGVYGNLMDPGSGSQVQCRSLTDIVIEHDLYGAQMASIDIEGSELDSLRCFPFRAFRIATWLVETNKSPWQLFTLFKRGGYAPVMDIMLGQPHFFSNTTRIGMGLDTVFRLLQPAQILGPDFLPGRPLFGLGPRPACPAETPPAACPEQIPPINMDEVDLQTFHLKGGACGYSRSMGHLIPKSGDVVLATAEEPSIGVKAKP